MSAWIVSKTHIDALVHAGIDAELIRQIRRRPRAVGHRPTRRLISEIEDEQIIDSRDLDRLLNDLESRAGDPDQDDPLDEDETELLALLTRGSE